MNQPWSSEKSSFSHWIGLGCISGGKKERKEVDRWDGGKN
jgi:hypothetical protein